MRVPAGVRLGPLELIEDGRARNFVLDISRTSGKEGTLFHGFIVRKGDTVFGYRDLCPHMSLPLAQKLDDYLSPDPSLISCSWHGALFNVTDGVCVGGPCKGQRLEPWPVRVADGFIVTA
jgi:nitrite reductase/ring-hydroxylating ferredoxin subunit